MIKLFILFFGLTLLSSCGYFRHGDKSSEVSQSPLLLEVQNKRDFYLTKMTDPYSLVGRCDGLTFLGLFDASTAGKKLDIYQHEYDVNADGTKTYKTGQIHRSIDLCYIEGKEENDSRSECSLENVLGYFHALLTRGDNEAIVRVIRKARDNDWRFCTGGPDEYVQQRQISFLLNDWENKIKIPLDAPQSSDDAMPMPDLSSYKGNVIGDYIILKGRIFGYINSAEKEMLKQLISASPDNPLPHIYYHRYIDGDQSKALSILNSASFPSDSLPKDEDQIFDWCDAPSSILYTWAVSIIEGK